MNFSKIYTFGLILIAFSTFGQGTPTLTSPVTFPKTNYKVLPALDIYAAIPRNVTGMGFGFGLFSKPIVLMQLNPNQHLDFRLGGDLYFLQMQHKNLGQVPLSAPQTGDAKVSISESNFGINLVGRFLLDRSNKLTPYLDVFGGLRGFATDLKISPIKKQEGYEGTTSKNLSSAVNWNYGATIGVLYSLGKQVSLNTGLMFSSSNQYGQIENVQGARVEGGSIMTEKINTPKNTLVFKVGFTFLVYNDKKGCDCKSGSNKGLGTIRTHSGGGTLKSNNVKVNVRPSK